VHQSLIENGDDLYVDSTRDSIFNRIRAIEDDAIALHAVVFDDFQAWMIAHNVNVDAASKEADRALRELKGI
jgi:hypothetical protein